MDRKRLAFGEKLSRQVNKFGSSFNCRYELEQACCLSRAYLRNIFSGLHKINPKALCAYLWMIDMPLEQREAFYEEAKPFLTRPMLDGDECDAVDLIGKNRNVISGKKMKEDC